MHPPPFHACMQAALILVAERFGSALGLASPPSSAWAGYAVYPLHAPPSSSCMQAALILVAERFGGGAAGLASPPSSAWAGYAASLPHPHSSSPLFWSEQHLGMIQGTQLLDSVTSYT